VAFSVWTRVQGLVFGGAIGAAFARAVEPILEPVRQRAWSRNPVRVLAIGDLADLVARGLSAVAELVDNAHRIGHDADNLAALAALRQEYPGLGTLDDLTNRKLITNAQLKEALSRNRIPADYHGAIIALFSDVLSPGELSAAIHRGLVPDLNPPLLKGQQPGPDRKVESYPVYPIKTLAEAEASGYDRERLGVLVGLQGLPMGPHEAAQAVFRGIITWDDYIAAFNESNNRNEWASAIFNQTRQIPTARDFIENWLRGYIGPDEAKAGAALHGMSPEHAQIIFENSGRAMNLHQITQALAYGASYNPSPADDPDPYHQSTLVGPLRPEYYELNEVLKYNLPSALYFRTLQQNGVLTQPEAETWYKRLGWPPELAEQVSKAFDKQRASVEKEATATDLLTLREGGRLSEAEALAALEDLGYPADEAQRKIDTLAARRVASAKGTAVTDIHAKYKKLEIDADVAVGAITQLGVPPWAATAIVQAWAFAVTAVEPP
jgi:hypothetical protein